jgi:hypothetical protein
MKTEGKQHRRTLPISVYQRRYWAKWAQNPRSSSFNTSIVFVISGGGLDKDALKRACHFVVRGHEILHATFSKDGSEQYYSGFGLEEFYTERGGVGADAIDLEVKEVLNRPFDLERGPLIRFYLLGCETGEHYFIAKAHHVLADAVSAKIVVSNIMTAYAASLENARELAPAGYSYADCIEALHASQTAEKEAAARAFWKDYLEGAPLTVAFPRKERPVRDDHASESMYFELDRSTAEALKKFAKENTTTLFIVLFALYGFLLATYARQRTVVISYPVNMRPQGHAHVLGCFVNLLVKKVTVLPETTFKMLVGELTRQRREAKPHMFYQLGNLVHQRCDVSADLEQSFFSVFFGETHLNNKPLALGELRVEVPNIPWSQEFDRELRLLYDPSDLETIKLRMDVRTGLFDREVILKFVEELRQMAGRVIHDERPLCQLAE